MPFLPTKKVYDFGLFSIIDYFCKICGLQACAANEAAVYIAHSHQLRRVARVHAAAILRCV